MRFSWRADLVFEPGVRETEENLAEKYHSVRSSGVRKFSHCLESNPTAEETATSKLRKKELAGD